MDIVKKNLISILCGVVALIAIILLFWPTGGYQDKLQANLDARKQTYTGLDQLLHRQRSLPIVVPGQSEPSPLGRFPNQPVIAAGKAAQQKVQLQSQQMLQDALAINKHELLVPDSLPSPRVTAQFRFTEEYIKDLNLRRDPNNADCIQRRVLDGVAPLTSDQVTAAAASLWNEKYKPQITSYGNNQSNQKDLQTEFDKEKAKLPVELMLKAASTHKMYVEPDALDYDPAVQKAGFQGEPASPTDIWFAQMGLWMENDLTGAIARANADSANVPSSTVKRLIKITLPRDSKGFYTTAATTAVGPNQPPPPPSTPDTVVPAVSPSGRVSNTFYDVVHFEMVVDVEADRIPLFLKSLTSGQFIYVNEVNLAKVDSLAMKNLGYIYGDQPVARLSLKGEILFLRGWTTPLMPAAIKQMLGIQPTQPTGL